jgi:glycogen debranching enzyme
MKNDLTKMRQQEWLEADGLGGFASGTVSGIRTRRYHALLLAATKPPAGRIVLVNGFDANVEIVSGNYAISSQNYSPDVIHPDGAKRIVDFMNDPWPKWTFALPNGMQMQPGIFQFDLGAGLGHLSEIADAEAPYTPRGCPFQAWSLAELIRLDRVVLV